MRLLHVGDGDLHMRKDTTHTYEVIATHICKEGEEISFIDCLLPARLLLNILRMGTICMSPPVKRHIDSHMSCWLSFGKRIYLSSSPLLAKDNWNMLGIHLKGL